MDIKYKTHQIPQYDEVIPEDDDFSYHLTMLAQNLKSKIAKVDLEQFAVAHWENLIKEWSTNPAMPLYIRKTNGRFPRGSEIIHKSGRVLIPCDNGPAHWSFSMCFNKNLLTLGEVQSFIQSDKIPIAMILKSYERSSKYRFTRHEIDMPNFKGWKIAHKKKIGLQSRKPINEMDMEILIEHFVQFTNPANMFLFPLKYAGLAEIDEIIQVFS